MFEEEVEICNEPLTKVCNNETIGKGEDICKTHYETNCETRFKEHEVEQDEPVCKMVIERKCQDVTGTGDTGLAGPYSPTPHFVTLPLHFTSSFLTVSQYEN